MKVDAAWKRGNSLCVGRRDVTWHVEEDRRSSVLTGTGGHAGEVQHKWRPEGGA